MPHLSGHTPWRQGRIHPFQLCTYVPVSHFETLIPSTSRIDRFNLVPSNRDYLRELFLFIFLFFCRIGVFTASALRIVDLRQKIFFFDEYYFGWNLTDREENIIAKFGFFVGNIYVIIAIYGEEIIRGQIRKRIL